MLCTRFTSVTTVARLNLKVSPDISQAVVVSDRVLRADKVKEYEEASRKYGRVVSERMW